MALPSVIVEWNFNNAKEVRKTTFYLLICVNMRSDTFQQNIVGNSIPLLLIKMGKKQKDYNLQSIFKIFYDLMALKVSKSQKQIMASWILPKNERWGNFQYIKLPQRSFFGRIQDNIFSFRDFLTFTKVLCRYIEKAIS